jgi:site-specific DNA-methyltransferase (adenine-specific)
MAQIDVKVGEVRQRLALIDDNSVNCIVTSPPYWAQRDYDNRDQIGTESDPQEYIDNMVEVMREARRVLREDGTCWLNIGDTWLSKKAGGGVRKEVMGIPWMLAFALRNDGWLIRQEIIWSKPDPTPESVRDRLTRSHETIFLLTKSQKYWFDVEAVKEPAKWGDGSKGTSKPRGSFNTKGTPRRDGEGFRYISDTRRKRSVWEVATSRYHGAHFAMFPPDLITPCILAGCPPDGTVLDPFGGSGTTAGVAATQGRNSIIIELNADYVRQVMPDRIKWILERASHPLDEYPNVDYDWGISATLSNTSPDSVR